MKVALVYDRVNKWGGAERVLLSLHNIFPDAPLFTSVYNPTTAPWAKDFKVITSFLQKIPFVKSHHEYFPFVMPIAFESFIFDEFDLVISVTSESAKGIITKPHTRHICLCLTPTRYLWSGFDEYFQNPIFRLLAAPMTSYLKKWDIVAAQRPDKYIAISREVQKRIKIYYERESTVIYPSVDEKIFGYKDTKRVGEERVSPLIKVSQNLNISSGYFLVVSRLSKFTQYKRVDLAVKAATQLALPLIVVGDGDRSFLKKIAGPTVRFVGRVSDEDLFSYYTNCRAFIFPGLEDFGLTMVEAQLAGKPVIAFKGGGAVEIIQEGKTGMFFNKQTTQSLVEALQKFNEKDYNSKACRENGNRFSYEIFRKEIASSIISL